MRRFPIAILLMAALIMSAGCPRSEPKTEEKKEGDAAIAPAPPIKVAPPSQPVEPDKTSPEEKPRF